MAAYTEYCMMLESSHCGLLDSDTVQVVTIASQACCLRNVCTHLQDNVVTKRRTPPSLLQFRVHISTLVGCIAHAGMLFQLQMGIAVNVTGGVGSLVPREIASETHLPSRYSVFLRKSTDTVFNISRNSLFL